MFRSDDLEKGAKGSAELKKKIVEDSKTPDDCKVLESKESKEISEESDELEKVANAVV